MGFASLSVNHHRSSWSIYWDTCVPQQDPLLSLFLFDCTGVSKKGGYVHVQMILQIDRVLSNLLSDTICGHNIGILADLGQFNFELPRFTFSSCQYQKVHQNFAICWLNFKFFFHWKQSDCNWRKLTNGDTKSLLQNFTCQLTCTNCPHIRTEGDSG